MKKIALAALLGLSFAAQAAHYDIKMLNSNSEGSMVFEPGYLKVQPGDTVTFRAENKSHFVHSKAIPEYLPSTSFNEYEWCDSSG